MRNKAAFGIYNSRTEVEAAVEKLKSDGFRNSDISVLIPTSGGVRELATEKKTKAPEGAATGVGTGAILGGALGWLVGIGALSVPGIGPLIAAGPIMAALAGAGIGGAVGGTTGALVGLGIPEFEAKHYEGLLKDGGILLSVHSDNSEWLDKARNILESTGGRDVTSSTEVPAESSRKIDKIDHRKTDSSAFPL